MKSVKEEPKNFSHKYYYWTGCVCVCLSVCVLPLYNIIENVKNKTFIKMAARKHDVKEI